MDNLLAKFRTAPWIIIVLLAIVIAVMFPIFPDGVGGHTTLVGFVLTWLGTVFKAMSAGVLGFWFCRHVLKLDMSELPEGSARAYAGIEYGLVIGAFIIAIAHS